MKTRISVTLTQPYLDAMNQLIEDGIYLSKGQIVLEALRNMFKEKGVALFTKPLEGPR